MLLPYCQNSQLPYWIDGPVQMTQSSAILRHLARKNGLYGKSEEEKIRIDVAEGVIADLLKNLVLFLSDPDCVSNK